MAHTIEVTCSHGHFGGNCTRCRTSSMVAGTYEAWTELIRSINEKMDARYGPLRS